MADLVRDVAVRRLSHVEGLVGVNFDVTPTFLQHFEDVPLRDTQWVFAFIDRPAEGFETAAAFWTTVLKWTFSSRRGDHGESVTLLPSDGDAYVKLQATMLPWNNV